jgi:hypothetical protein
MSQGKWIHKQKDHGDKSKYNRKTKFKDIIDTLKQFE